MQVVQVVQVMQVMQVVQVMQDLFYKILYAPVVSSQILAKK